MHGDPIATLIALHDTAHAALEELFFLAISALTELRIGDPSAPAADTALGHWRALVASLTAHQEAEELAFAGRLADTEDPPRGASDRIYLPEHKQLGHLLAAGRTVLVDLAATAAEPGLRDRMVRCLEPLWRVIHLVSHHLARERDIIYPWVLPRLTAAARASLAEGLTASIAAR